MGESEARWSHSCGIPVPLTVTVPTLGSLGRYRDGPHVYETVILHDDYPVRVEVHVASGGADRLHAGYLSLAEAVADVGVRVEGMDSDALLELLVLMMSVGEPADARAILDYLRAGWRGNRDLYDFAFSAAEDSVVAVENSPVGAQTLSTILNSAPWIAFAVLAGQPLLIIPEHSAWQS